MAPDWWPDWSGQCCVIVASGPSAKGVNLEFARGKARVIVINTSFRLAPWADVLYACDGKWWLLNKDAVKDFPGLLISQDMRALRHVERVQKVTCRRTKPTKLHMGTPGLLGWGGNSGFHALNLAAQFRAKKIILVGYDMTLDKGVHWHGKHHNLNNPTEKNVTGWRTAIDTVAPQLADLGILVINASPISALKAYPKMSLEDALAA